MRMLPRSSPAGSAARRRLLLVVGALVAVAVLVGGLGAARWIGRSRAAGQRTETVTPVATTTVTRGDISTASALPGTLGYGAAQTISGTGTGVITWLPAAGAVITRGQRVYAVDDRPVPLFYGRIPLFRDLDVTGTVGRDVRMVYGNLRTLGYAVGRQPSPGTVVDQPVAYSTAPAAALSPIRVVKRTVHDGEAVLTPALTAAIKAWQQHLELPATGELTVGSVLVLPSAVRVSALSAHVGAPATGDLLSATSTSKVITVQADESAAATVDNGDHATVAFSDGTTATARVTSVGTALLSPDGGDPSNPKIAITLVLDRPATLKRVDAADLQVSFAAQTHRQVLIVPINALLALEEGGYALQTPAGTLIAVKTGIFSTGRVEISGTGVTEGLTVVTAG